MPHPKIVRGSLEYSRIFGITQDCMALTFEHLVNSGQHHAANSNDSFLMTFAFLKAR